MPVFSSVDLNMPAAPTSIKVYSIPVDRSDPKLEDLKMIEAPILEVTNPDEIKPPNQERLDGLKKAATATHLVYDLPEGAQECIHQGIYEGRYQPNIRLLPDIRTRWEAAGWEGWEKRAAIETRGYHVLYSRGKGGPLGLNKHANNQVSGEVFLLKVSNTRDESGRRFYVDANVNPRDSHEMEVLAGTFDRLFRLEYYGTQYKGTRILGYLLPQNGAPPEPRYVGAEPTAFIMPPLILPDQRSPSDKAIFDKMMGKGFFSHVNFWSHEHSIWMRLLPDTQPIHSVPWDLEAWAKRATIGDNKYHMLLTLANSGDVWSPLQRNPHIPRFPVWGDVFILKVSKGLDRHGHWYYEDIDPDFELPPGMLSLYARQLAKIWEDLTDDKR